MENLSNEIEQDVTCETEIFESHQFPVNYIYCRNKEVIKKIIQNGSNNLIGSNSNNIKSNTIKELEDCKNELKRLVHHIGKIIELMEEKK